MANQSLYRRYRPRRFGELKGQDHVVRALRDAVAQGREGQAYLFSGPRGTGKTTSARILAKVLNCEHVVDGEPCCECESCLAVERGTSYDVHELDAASNRGIDAMRALIEKASLGTAGRHKVYILDEVHMLTKEASAALLKTLEEPPPHVVFVLATTDPQRVLDTIRSRTQHLQFHLLPSETLAEHVRWIAQDAGLDLPQSALDAALVRGGGSARDTLSALELLATTGGDLDEVIDLDEFLTAMIERDPGRALTAMGHAVNLGRDPRTITEELLRHLRDAFMALMAPELVMLPADRIDAVARRAQELGTRGIVRAIERLGSALVDMRHAPDPRILVEVALVQLTHDEAGDDADALVARLERLEQKVKQLGAAGGPNGGGRPAAPTDPTTGRAVLGGAARQPATSTPAAPAPDAPTPTTPTSITPTPAVSTPAADERPGSTPATTTPATPAEPHPTDPPPTAAAPTMSVPEAWEHGVKASVKPLVRALYTAGSFVGRSADGAWQFSVPNEAHGAKCNDHRSVVEAALAAAVGEPVAIEFVVDGHVIDDATPTRAPSAQPATPETPTAERPSGAERAARAAAAAPDQTDDAPAHHLPDDDEVDLGELTDAPPESVKTPIDRLAEAFPGSELISDD
jgi:DNA polymerase-3 subunit gamma/tau